MAFYPKPPILQFCPDPENYYDQSMHVKVQYNVHNIKHEFEMTHVKVITDKKLKWATTQTLKLEQLPVQLHIKPPPRR